MIRDIVFIASLVFTHVAPAEWAKVAGEWEPYNLTDRDKQWFSDQKGKNGSCCGQADGHPADWDLKDGHYTAKIDGRKEWMDVPDDAVIRGSGNPTGRAVVWLTATGGVRCFIPGSEI